MADSDRDRLRALLEQNPTEALRLINELNAKRMVPHSGGQDEVMACTARFQVLDAGRRWGKELCNTEPVLTDQGWREIGSLNVGDRAYGADGQACTVTGVYPQGVKPLVNVKLKDGTTIKAGYEHRWGVRRRWRNDRVNQIEVLTTQEIIDEGVTVDRANGRLEHRFAIPAVAPVELPEQHLPIPPYTLGALLGDGSLRRGTSLSSADHEVVANIEAEGVEVRAHKTFEGKCPSYGVLGLREHLRTLNLSDANASDKHVPAAYVQGSIQQRLETLRGLMDTDGWLESPRRAAFASASEQLVADVRTLVLSLGGKVTPVQRKPTTHKDSHVLRFYMPANMNPFRLLRKAERWEATPPERLARQIVSIEPCGEAEATCIAVDAPDHLFVARDFALTHNTEVGAAKIIKHCRRNNQMTWWIAPTYKIVKRGYRKVLAQLDKRLLTHEPPQDSAFDAGRSVILKFKNGSRMEFYSAERPEGMLGEGVDFAVLDEASKMPKNVWQETVRPTLMDRQGKALMISTPSGRNWFYYEWLKGQNDDNEHYKSWQFPSATNPYLPPDEIQQMKDDLPLVVYQQEVLAQFIASAGSVFRFEHDVVTSRVPAAGHVVVGVDLAKTTDFTVFDAARASDGMPCGFDRFNEVSWPMQRNRLKSFVRKLRDQGATHVTLVMDSTGVGDPNVEEMQLDGYDVVPINFTGTKQHMVMQLAKDLEDGYVRLNPEFLHEFENYTYKVTERGKFTYSAPEGQHDDVVSAKMLQHWGIVQEGAPNVTAVKAYDPEADDVEEDDGIETYDAGDDWSDLLEDDAASDTGIPDVKRLIADSPAAIMARGSAWR